VLVTFRDEDSLPGARPHRVTFSQDFKQFFLRGLAALLPTLITLWLLLWAWNFLWESLGQHLIYVLKWLWLDFAEQGFLPYKPAAYISNYWSDDQFRTRLVGVLLAVVTVYIVGFFVGNLIGRTFWKLGERLVMKIPIVRAIYPAVKQITDWLLTDRSSQFQSSRVVAVQPHEKGIWSIGLITGQGLAPMNEATGEDMIMVFMPNSPAAFSGYVLVVPRSQIVELPLTVEEAMRLFISGGVIVPGNQVEIGGRIVQPRIPPAKQPDLVQRQEPAA
jgi:uncharacterized membrane protein